MTTTAVKPAVEHVEATIGHLTGRIEMELEGSHVTDTTTTEIGKIFQKFAGRRISNATHDIVKHIDGQTVPVQELDEPHQTDPMVYLIGVDGTCIVTIKVSAITGKRLGDKTITAKLAQPILPDLSNALSGYIIGVADTPADALDI